MLSGARGGLGGTSRRRVARPSQASAMLTDVVLATTIDGGNPVRWTRPYQLQNPGAMKASRLDRRGPEQASLFPKRIKPHQGRNHDPTDEATDLCYRRYRSAAAADRVPADLVGEPVVQSRPVDPGGRCGLGDDPDDVIRRQGCAGADRLDAAGDADRDARR